MRIFFTGIECYSYGLLVIFNEGTVATHERARALTLEVILELVLGVRDAGLRGQLIENFDALANPRNDLALFLHLAKVPPPENPTTPMRSLSILFWAA